MTTRWLLLILYFFYLLQVISSYLKFFLLHVFNSILSNYFILNFIRKLFFLLIGSIEKFIIDFIMNDEYFLQKMTKVRETLKSTMTNNTISSKNVLIFNF